MRVLTMGGLRPMPIPPHLAVTCYEDRHEPLPTPGGSFKPRLKDSEYRREP